MRKDTRGTSDQNRNSRGGKTTCQKKIENATTMNAIQSKDIEMSVVKNEGNKQDKDGNEMTTADTSVEKKKKKRGRRNNMSVKVIATNVRDSLTCCNTWSTKSFFLFFLIVAVGTFHFIVLLLYATSSDGLFANLSRDFVFVFMVFFIMYTLLCIWFIIRWKSLVSTWLTSHYKLNINIPRRSKNNLGRTAIQVYKENIGLNGKFYLWKLYLYEFIENWVQFANMNELFLCTLPIEWTSFLCTVLIVESSYRSIFMGQHLFSNRNVTVHDRDRQVILDIVIDLVFLILPLAITSQMYNIKLTILETLRIAAMPTFSLFGKLRSLLMASLFENAEQRIVNEEIAISKRKQRRRLSLYNHDFYGKVETLQNKHFPRFAKLTVLATSIMYACLLTIILVFQLLNYSVTDALCKEVLSPNYDVVWKQGCVSKVAYCQDLFYPSCDCASIHIPRHNLTLLPNGTVKMTSLRRIEMRHGFLKRLPSRMERLTKLTTINFAFNELNEFNVDVSNMERLTWLELQVNNIQLVNEHVWKHPELTFITLSSNVGLLLPSEGVVLPRLYYLDLRNNSFELPELLTNRGVGKDVFPALKYLLLDCNHGAINGTKVQRWVDSSMKNNVIALGVSYCGLTSIPESIIEFGNLIYLDARGNDIELLSPAIKKWIEEKKIEAYFSRNSTVCKDNEDAHYCEQLCSEYCYSRLHGQNNFCDDSCNTPDCRYDGGDCL